MSRNDSREVLWLHYKKDWEVKWGEQWIESRNYNSLTPNQTDKIWQPQSLGANITTFSLGLVSLSRTDAHLGLLVTVRPRWHMHQNIAACAAKNITAVRDKKIIEHCTKQLSNGLIFNYVVDLLHEGEKCPELQFMHKLDLMVSSLQVRVVLSVQFAVTRVCHLPTFFCCFLGSDTCLHSCYSLVPH